MRLIDKIDPRMKLVWCLVLLFTALLSDNIVTEAAVLALVLITDILLTKSLKKYKVLLLLFLVVASQIFLMQILFNREGHIIADWWIISVYSGALPAALLGTLRTVAVSCTAIQMLSWTSADDAVLMLVSFKAPYRYAMLVSMAQRFFPLLKAEYQAIVDSQAVRGVPTNGLKNQLRLLPVTFLPFLYRSVSRTSEIALSMELRGFGYAKTRTFMKELHLAKTEVAFMALLLILFLVTRCYFKI